MDGKSGRVLSVRTGRGRRHDFRLWRESGVRVHPAVELLCDTGHQGMQRLHANCAKPVKASKKRPLTREQRRENRSVNPRRTAVEHAIRRLKIFRILSERHRNRRRRFGLRLNLIAAITNLLL